MVRRQVKTAPTVVLGSYPDPETGARALRDIRRSGIRRSAALRVPEAGRVAVADHGASAWRLAILATVIALGIAAVYLSPLIGRSSLSPAEWGVVALPVVVGVLAGVRGARWLGLSIDDHLLARYQRWTVPGETLVVAQVPAGRAGEALAVLRRVEGRRPATFVIRPQRDFPKPGPEEPRRERFTIERLKLHATRLAQRQSSTLREGHSRSLWNRLRDNDRIIDAIIEDLTEAGQLEQSVSLSAEWLLDNAYVVQRHIGDVRRNLSKQLYDVLPVLAAGPHEGQPRVYALASEFVAHTDAEIYEQDLVDCLLAYQEISPLTIGELWAMPLMLRLALVENLSRLAIRIDRQQHEHESADFWANRLLSAARQESDQLLFLLAELAREYPNPPVRFVDRLISQLQGDSLTLDPIRAWLERKWDAPVAEVIQQEQRRHAPDGVTIANAIGSLRLLSRLDWREIFERVSLVDRVLETDPAGVYALMDFGTRDRYRRVIEEVARRSNASELEVARAAVEAARLVEAEGRQRHVGYYLIDAGRGQLEAWVSYHSSPRQLVRRQVLRHPALVYLGSVGLATVLILGVAVALGAAGSGVNAPVAALALVAVLGLVPAGEAAVQLVNYGVTRLLLPQPLPKLSLEDGIPDDCRTLVVVPVLLLSPETVREELEHLEICFLGNREANLHFALLADPPDAPKPVMPEDAAVIQAAVEGIEALNARHGGSRFSLFIRDRQWSESEQAWMGWERKRGKLEELNRWLVGSPAPVAGAGQHVDTLRHIAGDPAQLRGTRFVITLDSDTHLPHGAARRLVGTMMHPLNRPWLNPGDGVVSGGYTIVQPRVSTSLPSAAVTRFSRFFTDPVGLDPYTQVISDLYQDLTGEGSYYGKGIYDVELFHCVVDGRFPEALLLSHDLLEGAHVRVGLASDVELFDDFPSSYLAHTRRQHRWIRGDWQVAEWCTPRVPLASGRGPNPLGVMNRWKILDNLRRSLVPSGSLSLLLAGWLLLPQTAPVWGLLVGAVAFLPAVLLSITWLATQPIAAWRAWQTWREVGTAWVRSALSIALLPHQAILTLDAIARVWYRRLVSHRHLLEWQTFQVANSGGHQQERRLARQMAVSSLFAAAVAAAIARVAAPALLAAAPFLAMWILSPGALTWLNGRRRQAAPALSPPDRLMLRRLARETWRYFDDLVGPETHWLPPDNYQEALHVELAERTSPTNIGLWLLATLAAHDFGNLTPDQAIDRGLATMATLERLERVEGHFLNWYSTRTLEPLHPRYVSTVDSGNLLGSLWASAQGYQELLSRPVIGPRALQGLADTLALALVREWSPTELPAGVDARHVSDLITTLAALFDGPPDHVGRIVRRLRAAAGPAHELAEALRGGRLAPSSLAGDALTTDAAYWAAQVERQLGSWLAVVDRYLPWVEGLQDHAAESPASADGEVEELRLRALSNAPSLRDLALGEPCAVARLWQAIDDTLRAGASTEPAREWLSNLAQAISRSREQAQATLERAGRLVGQAGGFADKMDMRFLYGAQHKLLTLGYNVEERRFDSSYYDLLASEARLASFVAVARGDVPAEHWFSLGRPFGLADGHRVLFSWSGTMFEYLMPLLLMRSYENSLLDEACRTAVAWQIEYGARRGVPWGISEAAFSAVDANQIYQYQAFGVPGLGLKRDLENDLVVAPYSTALALLVEPGAAVQNLKQLGRLGLRGNYGYYDSIDYTQRRLPAGGRGVIAYTYMAHHQGMSLLALDNALNARATQARFHADPRVRAAEPLLFERIPVAPLLLEGFARGDVPPRLPRFTPTEASALADTPDAPTPSTQLLGNGAYTVMVTSAGGGYSRWRDVDISRWRADTTCDSWGSFCYVKDVEEGVVWSATHQPIKRPAPRHVARFTADRVEFERRDAGISTITEVVVSWEDDVEIRRVTLINHSGRRRQLDVTSYVELALAPHNADQAHPAFSKLFVETEALPNQGALLAWRKQRAPGDPSVWAVHLAALPTPPEPSVQVLEYETDRARFVGRGRSADNPMALEAQLSNSAGPVLDPIFSLRCRVALDPGGRTQLAFVTGAADSRERALTLIEKYRYLHDTRRAFELAWSQAQLLARQLRVTAEDIQRYQQLASYLLFPSAQLRAAEQQLRKNRLDQRRLWAYGISGDLPILLITIGDPLDVELVREALRAHAYWRLLGFKADLVILNEEAGGYQQRLQEELRKLIQALAQYTYADKPGGVFLRSVEHIPDEDLTLLLAVARVVLVASRGPLVQQLGIPPEAIKLPPPMAIARRPSEEPSAPLPFLELPYFNGLGGFTPDGREYAIYLGSGSQTPAPWVNVIANPSFGALVSESGQGFAWYGNSQSNRLLPWSNDPLSDPSGDAIYIRDEQTGAVWTPTPAPIRELDAYRARHGQGYTLFEHNSHAVEQELATFVTMGASGGEPVRIQRLRLRNRSSHRRRLSVIAYAEWVLGQSREDTQMHVVTSWDADSQALLARNAYHPDFGSRVAFASASPPPASYTADRTEFLGRNGSHSRPAALARQSLSGQSGAGLDPCAALQVIVEIDPGQDAEVTLMLGQAADAAEARRLVERYRDPERVEQALQETRAWWDHLLEAIQVQTPELATNYLLNRWLLYQTLSCRIWARSAFYQSGGAFGFRDQLQDCLALVHAAPQIARQHILTAAARQFVEGDVQHWWHPQSGAGARTRISDDLLWLPYAAYQYARITGDWQILDEEVPFLEARALEPHEHEAYLVPTVSLEAGSLLEHCRRAIGRAAATGPHGLPLIGTGDWNDGLNLVGAGGSGESVWLAWFLVDVLDGFAELVERRGQAEEAQGYRERARQLAAAVEAHGWDGEWYLRAFFDDGTPLGSKLGDEAKIDSLPQSWGVISGAARCERAAQALRAVEKHLVREDEGLILLFTPPFARSSLDPGYVKGYPPGVRENGGQYTHAAIWVAMALARQGDGDRAARLLRMLNPIERARTPEDARRYRVEPYAVAADVYALEGHVGLGGWTWYTGSSGWLYRVWLEEILGFRLGGDKLTLDPVIPAYWSGFTIRYRHGGTHYEISVENPERVCRGVLWVELDGQRLPERAVPLRDDGSRHSVVVRLGRLEHRPPAPREPSW